MIKIRSILVFALLPLCAGYMVASWQNQKHTMHTSASNFNTHAILSNDSITLTDQGNIVSLTHDSDKQITNKQQLIEASPVGDNYIAVNKQTNFSTFEEFDESGKKIATLLNGDTGNIDTMDWFMDPAVDPGNQQIVFVSDKDKAKTNVLDNGLFVEDLSTKTITKIANPDPHSGGITHPAWNPTDPTKIIYDYYQYDTDFNPYSVIDEYDLQTKTTTQLTTQKQNAYQGSFSPNGKQFMFLGRNDDNTVNMYIADITDSRLANIQTIASGDFAYPAFSNTPNHIYYLQAQENSGYDLYSATVKNGKLTAVSAITTNDQLLANSGFMVKRIK